MRITKCGLHKWTKQDEDTLIHARAIGMTNAQISDLFEVDESVVKHKIHNMVANGKVGHKRKDATYREMHQNEGSKLPMTDVEIQTFYRDARDKKKQIKILAELNACSTDRIKKILGLGE